MNIAHARPFCARAASTPVFAFALALSACGPEEVTLVRYGTDAGLSSDDVDASQGFDAGAVSEPHADASGDARTRPDVDAGAGVHSCSSNADCTLGELCSMISCGAKKGTCVATSPFFCNGEQNPICGCDGLVYFNDCLRQEARVSVDATCLLRRSCDRVTSPCPGEAKCSYLYKGDRTCRQAAPIRECWVLPTECSLVFGGSVFASCDPLSPDICVNLCQAIDSQLPFTESRCGRPPSGGPSNITFTP